MTPHVPAPGRRICIVTPGYISSTPRVVREADALSAAGYDVRVVFTQGHLENVRGFDEALMRIEKGSFGICKDCGEPIAEARLNAIPWTRVCITCKEKQKA